METVVTDVNQIHLRSMETREAFFLPFTLFFLLRLVFFQERTHTHKKHFDQHFYPSWSSSYYKMIAIKIFVLETQAEV